MDYAAAAEMRWRAHPTLARVVRAAIALLPVGLSVALSLSAAHFFPPARLGLNKWLWWVLVAGLSTLVLLGTDRLMRRLLPLTALLKMTLIFPDQAPSRFRMAMRTGTTKQLERLVDETRTTGVVNTEIDHAARMLELVAALSAHDRLTRGHCERVRAYTDLIVAEMHLGEREANLLRWSALLHDVGKLRVPQEILNSDQRPSKEEWTILMTHPAEGLALTECLGDWLGEWRRTIGEHHERWDGNGYPSALGGSEIHLGARIVAVADAFDVMTSARSYKKPVPAAAAREEIARCSGSQFDPAVVRAFLNIGLRRLQFALGPLAWLSNLPLVGQAPLVSTATNAIGGVVTASLLTAATLGSSAAAQSQSHQPTRAIEVSAPVSTQPATATSELSLDGAPLIDDRSSTTIGNESAVTEPTSVDSGSTVPTTALPGISDPTTTISSSPPTSTTARSTPTVPPGGPTPQATPTTSPTTLPSAATTPPTTVPTVTTAAPTTTTPPTTTPAPTTTAPGTATQSFYLTASGTLSATTPAVVGANEPDVDGDGKPGQTVKKGASHSAAWITPLDLGGHLQGQVTLDLFSGVNNFNRTEQQTLSADLQMCDALGLNCTSILSNTWVYKPWAVGGVNTWSERLLVLGPVDVIVPPTFKLRVVLTAVERDMQIAMSGDRPSALQITLT